MKPIIILIGLSLALVYPAAAAPVITERGPHHRVWESVQERNLPNGAVHSRTSRYVELSTGMHYQKDGQWVETEEKIEVINGFAVARKGPSTVLFANNLNSEGAVDLLSEDGHRFRSHILGLAYTDKATGESVILAVPKDCEGVVIEPNQVYYLDAFEGDCEADGVFTYTKFGIEQDIVIVTAPPGPEHYGLNPETTRLEVFTEFLNAPSATVVARVLEREPDEQKRAEMVEPDLVDEELRFGAMFMGTGRAFALGEGPFGPSSVSTGKEWKQLDQRRILIEKVDYSAIEAQLDQLPQMIVDAKKPGAVMIARAFPDAAKGAKGAWEGVMVAQARPNRPGFVLDYVLSGSATNFVFQGDTTYVVSGVVNLHGTNVLEAGTVVKYTNITSQLRFYGAIDCLATPWRPATFTAYDDNTVGEILQNSTGSPTNYYMSHALSCSDTSRDYELANLRIRHALTGISVWSGSTVDLRHTQIGNSGRALWCQSNVTVENYNVLFWDLTHAVLGTATSSVHIEHGTIHDSSYLLNSTSIPLTLVNSLLISVTNNAVWTTNSSHVETNLSSTGIFRTVGDGNHYLATNSPYLDAGTTNIDAGLLQELADRTTFPPEEVTGPINVDVTWTPQAERDLSDPDLGYHYEPLDYLVSGISVTNSTILLTNGVVVGIGFTGGDHGLKLESGAHLISEGTPLRPNRIAWLNAVQEGASGSGWSGKSTLVDTDAAVYPSLNLRFTHMPLVAGSFLHGVDSYFDELRFQDCELGGGEWLAVKFGANQSVRLANNLFDRVNIGLFAYDSYTADFYNNTFAGGAVALGPYDTNNTWTVQDCIFDGSTVSQSGPAAILADYNAYTPGITRLTNGGGNDVITNVVYDFGPLGGFYLALGTTSTNFFNVGSRNATNAGLYHFTTTIDQSNETNSVVDLGYHYVGLDTNGLPYDVDGDGLADYFEDRNGNGSHDTGETDWETYNSLFGGGSGPGLQLFTPLRP